MWDEKSTVVTSRMIRGRNQILRQELLSNSRPSIDSSLPVIRGMILPVRNFVVCSGGVVSPGFLRHYLSSDGLFRDEKDEAQSRLTLKMSGTHLKVVQVQDLRKWGSSFHPLQPCFLSIRNLDLDLRYGRLIHWSQTEVRCVGLRDGSISMGCHALFLLGQVCRYRIWGVDGFILRPASKTSK